MLEKTHRAAFRKLLTGFTGRKTKSSPTVDKVLEAVSPFRQRSDPSATQETGWE